MIVDATPDQATSALRAMATVASAGGTEPLSPADGRGIAAAWHTVFGLDGDPPVEDLDPIEPGDLASAVTGKDLRLTTVRLLTVMALVDAVVDDAKLAAVGDFADALDVHEDFVSAVHALLVNDVAWVAFDEIRHNVATIPGVPWEPDHPYAPFLPYGEGNTDPALAARHEALADKPEGTLGREFFEHYRRNGFEFPGQEGAVVEAWATAHDCLHLLSGYSTSAQGELLVAAFTGASLGHDDDMMESHVIPTILIYHMGIELNKGLNKGDQARMEADPSWRDNYEGNVHLGLDPAKLWVAWDRGRQMSEDLYSGHWVFWDHVDEPLDDLRARYTIPPLDVHDGGLPDDAIDTDQFSRPGYTVPELGKQRVPER